jgi:DNA-binding transcriptional ArsR family regulator
MSVDGSSSLEAKARIFRALGDSSRLAVLEALRDGPKCVSDLVALTGLSQPNVSGHLAFLRECGLVDREQRGRFAYYSLAEGEVETLIYAAEAISVRDRNGHPRYPAYSTGPGNSRPAT